MTNRVLTMDQLCAVVAEAFLGANASLANAPLTESASPAPALSYRIPRETKYALRTIPYSAFYHLHRYRLSEITFSLSCCVSTRRVEKAKQTVLSLRAPPWWKRIFQAPVCKRIDIVVSAEGVTVRFGPGDLSQLPRWREKRVLLLTPEQKAALKIHP